MITNRYISAPRAARDYLKTLEWSILKTDLYLLLQYLLAIILLCLFQFYCQDGKTSYCSIQIITAAKKDSVNVFIGTHSKRIELESPGCSGFEAN